MFKKVITLSALSLLASACGGGGSDEGGEITQNTQGSISISGSAEYGASLEAKISDADGVSPATNVTYQWQRNSVNITGATTASYQVTADDFNQTIRAVATYVDNKGFNNSVTSAPTASISAVDFPGTLTIKGSIEQGQSIQAEITDNNGIDMSKANFLWLADNQVISNQDGPQLSLVREYVGKKISVQVTYTDENGFIDTLNGTQTVAVAKIANIPGAVSLAAADMQVGTAIQVSLTDDNGLVGDVNYYWYANDELIADVDQASYTLTQSDAGKSIHVKAEYVDADGYTESVLSEKTAEVISELAGIPDGKNYPVGAFEIGTNAIARNPNLMDESFEGGGWNAGTIFPDTYTPGRDTNLPKRFRFTQFQGPHAFEAETNIARLGNYSAKLHWRHDNPGQWNGDPNKIVNNDRKAMFHGRTASGHTATTWYGFSVYFPSNGVTITDSQNPLIFQLHGSPDKGEPGRQPPIAVTVDKDALNVGYGWDAREFNTNTAGQGRGKFSVPMKFSENQDRWIDIVLQVSTNPLEPKGFVKLWVDGIQVLHEQDLQIGYNDGRGMYPSWGWYQIGNNVNRITDATMYMDEFRHAESADAGYYDVAPGFFAQ